MNIFSRPRQQFNVEVIGIEHKSAIVKDKTTSEYSTYKTQNVVHYKQDRKRKSTLVLYTVAGELMTKEFDGQWTLEQVRNWNKSRFIEQDEEMR